MLRILIAASRHPWPPHRGDQARALQVAELLALEHEVTLLVPEPKSSAVAAAPQTQYHHRPEPTTETEQPASDGSHAVSTVSGEHTPVVMPGRSAPVAQETSSGTGKKVAIAVAAAAVVGALVTAAVMML